MWVHSPFPNPEEAVVFRFLNYYFKVECIDSMICTLCGGAAAVAWGSVRNPKPVGVCTGKRKAHAKCPKY